MSLLRDIQEAAVGNTEPITNLLRRCKILAARLGSTEFAQWVERELNGYAHRWDGRYFDPPPAEQTTAAWLTGVRGDKVLGDLFSQLSETRVRYDKVRHGVALTEWLLEHSSESLREVAQLLERALAGRST